MAKKQLAAVTMFYNEPDFLPIWLGHYARAVGAENCYLLDHGSDAGLDALRDYPGVHHLPLPRSPFDENWRRQIVAGTCNRLLDAYRHVLYADIDELLAPDPARATDLLRYCETDPPEVTTAFGCNVLQMEDEPPLDPAAPVGGQRRWIRPAAFLCKPLLTNRSIVWFPGFHHADAPSSFAGLYLFHLAYADRGILKRRQRKRVGTPRAADVGPHHGWSAHDMVWHIRHAYLALPRTAAPTLGAAPEAAFTARILAAGEQLGGGRARIKQEDQADTLWELPDSFRDAF